jgi:two-component system cell cycle response regulator DivK
MAKARKKVLIVEDHSLNLKLFRDILRAKGFDTLEDRVGRHCIEYAENNQPDLIILDILLPYSSGIELAHKLKKNSKTKHIPLLGVTALAISDTHDKMIEAGCVDCLTKPFTLDQFLSAIDFSLQNVLEIPQKRHKKSALNQLDVSAQSFKVAGLNY